MFINKKQSLIGLGLMISVTASVAQDSPVFSDGFEAEKYSHVAGYQGKCVTDNTTGLMWEVKQDSGLHSKTNSYTWYSTVNNGGNPGTQNGGSCDGSNCDTAAFVAKVNSIGWCGHKKGWRLPTREELKTLVVQSQIPAINTTYFPNTKAELYWSSSPSTLFSSNAGVVNFYNGANAFRGKHSSHNVRLVRGSTDH